MSLLTAIPAAIRRLFSSRLSETDPEQAYDLWAAAYDAQPDNLMLAMDETLFAALLEQVNVHDKTVIDIGCGTGRHWQKILDKQPKKLTGYDVSAEMLQVLKQKFPSQETFRLNGNRIDAVSHSCDILVSTLTLAHIAELETALAEWERVLKPGGEIIITDYHPDALAKGGKRTFRHADKLVAVKNYVYSIDHVTQVAKQLGLSVLRISERKIDESVKVYYEKQNALAVYEQFKGVPIIYGLHLKKKDATV
jgi:ubiquinone/menaquinone biosynthesis C-methylase UbiE